MCNMKKNCFLTTLKAQSFSFLTKKTVPSPYKKPLLKKTAPPPKKKTPLKKSCDPVAMYRHVTTCN